jgi:transcriptional regulator with XRE-family HTH domain
MPNTASADIPPALAMAGRVSLKAIRETVGYSMEELSLTCGLATNELVAIENGMDADPAKLQRIASALKLPDSFFTTSN